MVLYSLKKKSGYYHTTDQCGTVKGKKTETLTYGQLEEEAYRKLKQAGITVIVHVIFSLPGETREDMLETIRYLSSLDPVLDGIKIQMLNVLKGTRLAEEYEKEPFPLLSLEEYAHLVKDSVDLLPQETVIHRISGDGPGPLILAPDWVRNKKKVLNTIHSLL